MPGSCGEEARHKKSPFLRCLGLGRPKKLKGDFCAGLLWGRGAAQKVTFFEVLGFCAGLLRGRGAAQKVTFFEVLGAGQAQRR